MYGASLTHSWLIPDVAPRTDKTAYKSVGTCRGMSASQPIPPNPPIPPQQQNPNGTNPYQTLYEANLRTANYPSQGSWKDELVVAARIYFSQS